LRFFREEGEGWGVLTSKVYVYKKKHTGKVYKKLREVKYIIIA